MSMSRSSRMLHYINYRMRITLQDARMLVGTFMAFDRHMNIVLGDTEEFRRLQKHKKGSGITEDVLEKRVLGLIVLRGDSVVSMTIEGPPPPEGDERLTPGGPGVGRAAGRGMPVAPGTGAPMGLAGPVRGVGGPSGQLMGMSQQVAAQMPPQTYPRGAPGMAPGMGMPGMMPPPGGMPGMPGMPPPQQYPRGPPGPPGMMMGPPGMMPPPGPPGGFPRGPPMGYQPPPRG